jgi:hypothetical protein
VNVGLMPKKNEQVKSALTVTFYPQPSESTFQSTVDNEDALTSPGTTLLGVMETSPNREASAQLELEL